MNTPTNRPTKTQIYQQEEMIATEFGQVIQKRKTLNNQQSSLNWRDHVYIFKNLPTVNPQQTKEAVGYGLVSGLAVFWAMGCFGGGRSLRSGARTMLARTTSPGGGGVSPFRQAEQLQQQSNTKTFSFFGNNNKVPTFSPRTRFLIDATLSTMVGFQVTLLNIDPLEKQKVIANIPVEQPANRGGIADNLCGALVAEYQRQWKLESPQQQRLPQQASEGTRTGGGALLTRRQTLQQPHREDLQILFRFIQNCQKRQQQEQQQQQQTGTLSPLDEEYRYTNEQQQQH